MSMVHMERYESVFSYEDYMEVDWTSLYQGDAKHWLLGRSMDDVNAMIRSYGFGSFDYMFFDHLSLYYESPCRILEAAKVSIDMFSSSCSANFIELTTSYYEILKDQMNLDCSGACLAQPCINGGSCTVDDTQASGYVCACPDLYDGDNCELNLCDVDAAVNTASTFMLHIFNAGGSVGDIEAVCTNFLDITITQLTQHISGCPMSVVSTYELIMQRMTEACDDVSGQLQCSAACLGSDYDDVCSAWSNSVSCDTTCPLGVLLMPLLCPQPECSVLEASFCETLPGLLVLDDSTSGEQLLTGILTDFRRAFPGFGSFFSDIDVDFTTNCWADLLLYQCMSLAVHSCPDYLQVHMYTRVTATIDVQCFDPCVHSLCMNDGVCVPLDMESFEFDVESSYRCQCLPGYTGHYCETAPECSTTAVSSCTSGDLSAYFYMRMDGPETFDFEVSCGAYLHGSTCMDTLIHTCDAGMSSSVLIARTSIAAVDVNCNAEVTIPPGVIDFPAPQCEATQVVDVIVTYLSALINTFTDSADVVFTDDYTVCNYWTEQRALMNLDLLSNDCNGLSVSWIGDIVTALEEAACPPQECSYVQVSECFAHLSEPDNWNEQNTLSYCRRYDLAVECMTAAMTHCGATQTAVINRLFADYTIYVGDHCSDLTCDTIGISSTTCISEVSTEIDAAFGVDGPWDFSVCLSLDASIRCVEYGLSMCISDDSALTSYNSVYTTTMISLQSTFCAEGSVAPPACVHEAYVCMTPLISQLSTAISAQTPANQQEYCSMIQTVQACLAFHVGCDSTVYTELVASVDAQYADCPTPPDPDECGGVSVYVECYASLTVYLNTCADNVGGCDGQQACLNLDVASECMLAASNNCDASLVAEWSAAYEAAISATAGAGLITYCTNVCATDPCHNNGICTPAANDDGFTCLCPSPYLPPYCVAVEGCDLTSALTACTTDLTYIRTSAVSDHYNFWYRYCQTRELNVIIECVQDTTTSCTDTSLTESQAVITSLVTIQETQCDAYLFPPPLPTEPPVITDPMCPSTLILEGMASLQVQMDLQMQTGGLQAGRICGLSLELEASLIALMFCPAEIEDEVATIMATLSLSFDFEVQCVATCNIVEAQSCVAGLSALITSASFSSYSSICVEIEHYVSCYNSQTVTCNGDELASLESEYNSLIELTIGDCSDVCSGYECHNGGNCIINDDDEAECVCSLSIYSGDHCEIVAEDDRFFPFTAEDVLQQTNGQIKKSKRKSLERELLIFGQSFDLFRLNERGAVMFGSANIGYLRLEHPHRNIREDGGSLAVFLSKLTRECYQDNDSDNLHERGDLYSHEYIYHNDPDADSEETRTVIERANNIVHANTDHASFSANHVLVFTMTGLLPKPCAEILGDGGELMAPLTLQAVVISDGAKTFATYITSLNADDIRAELRSEMYVGYQFSAETYVSAVQDVSQADANTVNNEWGIWFYTLFEGDGTPPPPADRCGELLPDAPNFRARSQNRGACPCTVAQAQDDPRWDEITSEGIADDQVRYYHSQRSFRLSGGGAFGGRPTRVKKVCAYNSADALLTQSPAGPYYLIVGNDDPWELYRECVINNPQHAAQYYEVVMEAMDTCEGYQPPRRGGGGGDPHFITFDGVSYTYNGLGEFMLAKSDDNTINIQCRTEQAVDDEGGLIQATVYKAVGVYVQGAAHVFATVSNGEIHIWRNTGGAWTQISAASDAVGQTVEEVPDQLVVTRTDDHVYNLVFPSVELSLRVSVMSGVLFFSPTLGSMFDGRLVGLLGNKNGDEADEYTARDGTLVVLDDGTAAERSQQLYEQFGSTWRLNEDETIMMYTDSESFADFRTQGLAFTPMFVPDFPDDETEAAALELCGDNLECQFDYVATRDPQVAQATLDEAQDVDNTNQNLENMPPNLNAPATILVNDGETVTHTLTWDDPNESQTVEVTMQTDNTAGANFNQQTGELTWTMPNLELHELSFTAQDNLGATTSVYVQVVSCSGCGGNGECVYNENSMDLYIRATCDCEEGWEGDTCEDDFDACSESPCHDLIECTDLTPAESSANDGALYQCSGCPDGYEEVQGECMDINECNAEVNPCQQECDNTLGGYECVCADGYRMDDQNQCVDIDECEDGTAQCAQECTNSAGSYECSCYRGYIVNPDDSMDCVDDPDTDCSLACVSPAICTLSDTNQPQCTCPDGYQTDDNNDLACTNINECSDSSLNSCENHDLCSDTEGSYTCGCHAGTRLTDDERTCEACPDGRWGDDCSSTCDCGANVASCDAVTGCTVCVHDGWTGYNCVEDVDECAQQDTHTCDTAVSTCSNTDGGYECVCNAGYNWDEDTSQCQECTDGFFGVNCSSVCNCLPNTLCDRTTGCTQCAQGWQDADCATDIDECATPDTHDCVAPRVCNNTAGSYECVCREGYTGDECLQDVDECQQQTYSCQDDLMTCSNTEGGYDCVCPEHYTNNNGTNMCDVIPQEVEERPSGDGRVSLKVKLEGTFAPDYTNVASARAQQFIAPIVERLTIIYASDSRVEGISIYKLASGSIDAYIELLTQVNEDSPLDQIELARLLQEDITANGGLAGHGVLEAVRLVVQNNGTITAPVAVAVCSVYNAGGYCENGGTCEEQRGMPVCSCTEGWIGDHCHIEEKENDASKNLTIALACVGGFLGLVAIIFALVACKLKSARRQRRHKHLDDESGSGSDLGGQGQYDWFRGWWMNPYDHGMVQGKHMAPKVRPSTSNSTGNSRTFWQASNSGYAY